MSRAGLRSTPQPYGLSQKDKLKLPPRFLAKRFSAISSSRKLGYGAA